MPPFSIAVGPNLRRSPYFEATVADGVRSFSVYNHMLIPGNFGDPDAEYARLIDGVVMWDVAAQRQVALEGPDAAQLVRLLTPRRLERLAPGQGRYIPLCDHQGVLINDPVLLPLSETRFWLSIADSDAALWAEAIAHERGLDVRVSEPDVSPLAIQGPKAVEVAAALFGDWVRDLRYFGFREATLDGIPLVVARSGWSKQGGYELYLTDGTRGGDLWRRVKQAGAPHGIIPGAPNDWERIESGLLSYGADARRQERPADPFELGLGALVELERPDEFIGKQALQARAEAGQTRRRTGWLIDGPAAADPGPHPILCGGAPVGTLWEHCRSPRLGRTIGIGLAAIDALDRGGPFAVSLAGDERAAEPSALPFL